jgi:hypothetical protein
VNERAPLVSGRRNNHRTEVTEVTEGFERSLNLRSESTEHNISIICSLVDGFFDFDDNFEVHRRNLPHRRQAGVIYFVTFHLADSLPTKKLAALEKEKKSGSI